MNKMGQNERQAEAHLLETIGRMRVANEAPGILSPLRLPVPPSRLFVEVPDFTAYFTFYVFLIPDNDCATVQEEWKYFMDFHRSLSPACEVLCGSSRAMMSTQPSNNEDIRTRFYRPTQS